MVRRYVPESNIQEMATLKELFFRDGLSWEDELGVVRRLAKKDKMKAWRLYYQSKFWKIYRQIVLRRDGFACVECGSKHDLNVDHKRYPQIIGHERPEDLQTLCLYCHAEKTVRFDLRAASKGQRLNVRVDDEMFMYNRR